MPQNSISGGRTPLLKGCTRHYRSGRGTRYQPRGKQPEPNHNMRSLVRVQCERDSGGGAPQATQGARDDALRGMLVRSRPVSHGHLDFELNGLSIEPKPAKYPLFEFRTK